MVGPHMGQIVDRCVGPKRPSGCDHPFMAFQGNPHENRAVELLAQLDKVAWYTDDEPETALTNADPATIATAALAHGLLALVDEVHSLKMAVLHSSD